MRCLCAVSGLAEGCPRLELNFPTKEEGRSGVTLLAICLAPSLGAAAGGDSKFTERTTAECLEEDRCQEQILNRIETRMGELEYQAGFPTASTVERLYDEMDYQRAVLAHQLSDNLVSF